MPALQNSLRLLRRLRRACGRMVQSTLSLAQRDLGRSVASAARGPSQLEPTTQGAGNSTEPSSALVSWPLTAAIEDLIDTSVTNTVLRSESRLEEHLDRQLASLGQLMVGLVRFPPLRVDYDLDHNLAEAQGLADVVQAVSPDIPLRPLGWDEEVVALRNEVHRLEEAVALSERRLRDETDFRLRTERLCVRASSEREDFATVAKALRDEWDSISRQLATANRALAQSVEIIDHLKAQVSKRDSSLASLHTVIKKGRQSFRDGLPRYSDTLKKFHAYLQDLNEQRFVLANLDLGDDSLLPPVLQEFLRDFAAMEFELSTTTSPLGKRSHEDSAAAISSPSPKAKARIQMSPDSNLDEVLGDVDCLSEDSDDSCPVIPSLKRRRHSVVSPPADAASPAVPKKPSVSKSRSRLGRRSNPPVKGSVLPTQPSPGVPEARPRSPTVAAASSVEQTDASSSAVIAPASVGAVPAPCLQAAPSSPHSLDASTSSMPGSPVGLSGPPAPTSSGGREEEGGPSPPAPNYDSPYEASVFIQARKDGRPVRSASTVASLQSKVAVENENAPDDVVLGLEEPWVRRSAVGSSTQDFEASAHSVTAASVSSHGGPGRNSNKASATAATVPSRQRPATRSPSVVPATPARRPVAQPVQPKTGLVPIRQTKAQARRTGASSRPAVASSRRVSTPRRGHYDDALISPPFASPGAEECWCEILEVRTAPPVPASAQVECSVEGIAAFCAWTDPCHPFWQFVQSHPAEPFLFDVAEFMPDVPISIRATGVALLTKLWRQFCCRAVGTTESHDLSFALYERAHWVSPTADERWLGHFGRRVGEDSAEFQAVRAAWLKYSAERNARLDRLRIQIKRWWAQLLPDADGKFGYTPEVLFEPSVLHYAFETLSWLPSSANWVDALVEIDGHEPWRTGWIAVQHQVRSVQPGFTLEQVASAVVVDTSLDGSKVSAQWVREYTDYIGPRTIC